MNDTTFWQDHEKGQNTDESPPESNEENGGESDENEYEYQYYYDYGDGDVEGENGSADQWEYYDEMYVTPEEE